MAESVDSKITVAREASRVRLGLSGCFRLENVRGVERAIDEVEVQLAGSHDVDIDLDQIERIDGAGAILLARLIDRLETAGRRVRYVPGESSGAARLVSLYRERRQPGPAAVPKRSPLARLGATAAQVPIALRAALHFIGHFAAATPKAVARRSVDWRSLPDLLQRIGADGLPVTAAANLLVGLIVGFIGVAQLSRFGAVRYVPELVVVAHFRELGPLSRRSSQVIVEP